MIDLEEIQQAIAQAYATATEKTLAHDLPLAIQARQFDAFAREYIGAASVLSKEGFRYVRARLQLTGQAVELSLKACLASANVTPPTVHDLIDLYRRAHELHFDVDAKEFAALVHLNHFYFADLATRTKFKARYPTKRDERLGGAVPKHTAFALIVELLLKQAAQRAPF